MQLHLKNLLKFKDDEAVLNKLLEIKTEAKKTCKEFILPEYRC